MVSPKKLKLPLSETDVLSLRASDSVLLSGEIITGRDKVHKYLFHEKSPKLPFDLRGSVIYHTGPIITERDGKKVVIAAGPTTSARVEMYEPFVIEHYGLRGIIGKGGMGRATKEALVKYKCVYFHAISGAAAYIADRILDVKGVFMLDEFGMAEAMWLLAVADFPAVVTMDAHGASLHEDIEASSLSALKHLIK